MKKKIVIFSGAGVSRESGILTFRDNKDGLWNNHSIDQVATPEGWRKDRSLVLNFYNERRKQLPDVLPNDAHKAIADLEKEFDVTVITQNVDDLHERAGSTNIIHLHGELTKARGSIYNHKPSLADNVIDIGYNEINIGDKCPVTGSQLRPHIVWFGEYPFGVELAYKEIAEADYLIIVGTSLQIGYTIPMLASFIGEAYYVGLKPIYVKKGAVEGVAEVITSIMEKQEA
jgi:NAD-dependent deacetylase